MTANNNDDVLQQLIASDSRFADAITCSAREFYINLPFSMLVVGKPNSGKSTLVSNMLSTPSRYLVFPELNNCDDSIDAVYICTAITQDVHRNVMASYPDTRYVLVPSSILTDSERNALLDRSRLNAASSTVNRIERQIASIASNPTLSSEHKAEQLKTAVSGLDSATRDYLHTVADVNTTATNTVVRDEPMVNDANVEEESSSITAPYYTRPPPDQAPIAPIDESLAGRETLTLQQQQPSLMATMQSTREPAASTTPTLPSYRPESASATVNDPCENQSTNNKHYFANFKNKFYRTRSGRRTSRTKRLIDEK
uniref:G domain-containing protein n=1 Tax=Plectus sambesii TaxID=2011161 RepID=A0A914WM15_9BILA